MICYGRCFLFLFVFERRYLLVDLLEYREVKNPNDLAICLGYYRDDEAGQFLGVQPFGWIRDFGPDSCRSRAPRSTFAFLVLHFIGFLNFGCVYCTSLFSSTVWLVHMILAIRLSLVMQANLTVHKRSVWNIKKKNHHITK